MQQAPFLDVRQRAFWKLAIELTVRMFTVASKSP
jgi:hypothetical protein